MRFPQKKTNLILKCFKGSFVYKTKEAIILCIYWVVLSSQQEQYVQFQALHFTEDVDELEKVRKQKKKKDKRLKKK